MCKTAKILLALALVCMALGAVINLGWIHPGDLDAFYVVLPLGATFFGLFLIVLVLQKESERHDEEHKSAGKPVETPVQKASAERGANPKHAEPAAKP